MKRQGLKYKMWKKLTCGVATVAVALNMMPAMNVLAASQYTVTFRPGNVGHFALTTDNTDKSAKEMAQEVVDQYYQGLDATVTEKGAIKITVPAGTVLPAVPAAVVADTGYYVKSWGPEAGTKASKNVDFVADYGRLTDGVEYTIKYVDAESGESIAPFVTVYGNKGDTVSVNANATLKTSNAGVYGLTNAASQSLVLGENADDNVITFTYAYNYDPGTVEEEVVRTIPGDTVTTTQTVTTVVDNGTTTTPGATQIQGGGANAAGNAGAGNVADNGGADANADDAQNAEQQADQEQIDIPDENTPLADAAEDDTTDETVTIEDEEAPLATMQSGGVNMTVVCAGVLGVAAIILAIIWMQARKRSNHNDNN